LIIYHKAVYPIIIFKFLIIIIW